MKKALTIYLPEDLYTWLKKQAEKNLRSLSQEVIFWLGEKRSGVENDLHP